MSNCKLSDELTKQLRSFGWMDSGNLDVDRCATTLHDRYGLEISMIARWFLESFGGLALKDKDGTLTYIAPLKIKLREKRGSVSWGDITLYPVGYLRDTTVILMDEKGATYKYWDCLVPFADSPVETLERLLD